MLRLSVKCSAQNWLSCVVFLLPRQLDAHGAVSQLRPHDAVVRQLQAAVDAMSTEDAWYHSNDELAELRRQDHVLESFQRMLNCERRGLCLLHEWLRRYGTPGSGCNCFRFMNEHLLEEDRP